MSEVDGQMVAVFVVVTVVYVTCIAAGIHYATARTPVGVVERLFRTGEPITLDVNVFHPPAWDPSMRFGVGGFHSPGVVTYTLDDPRTIRARFQPRSGPVIERSGPIPANLLNTPERMRRTRIARAVIALYVAVGLATFSLTAALVDGTASLRARIGGLCALGSLALAWLVTHAVLTRKQHSRRLPTSDTGEAPPTSAHHRHLTSWAVAYLAVSAAFGVAWHLNTLGDEQPIPWASAFLDAAIFVLISGAAVAASLHHHHYIHHADENGRPKG